MTMMDLMNKQDAEHSDYLGDGVYSYFDGYAVHLIAPREGGDHFIVLEPQIKKALDRFIERMVRTERSNDDNAAQATG